MFNLNRRQFVVGSGASLILPKVGFSETTRDEILKERTQESIEAVRRGMKWLEDVRLPNGGYGTDIRRKDDIGCTAMVGLAKMASGHIPYQGNERLVVRDIIQYMLKKIAAMPESNITNQTSTQLQNKIGQQAHTFFALLFMSQVAGESHSIKHSYSAIRKLVKAVVNSQLSDGSWGRTSWAPVLGTVMGWTSLRSSHFAGFDVKGSPEKTAEHLIKKMSSELGRNRRHWMHQLYKNAAGIRVLYAMGKDEEPVVKKSFKEVVDLVSTGKTAFNQAGGEEYLAFHLITETMLQKGGKDWAVWYPEVRDKIIGVQNRDGSWTGHHCITSRTFCTAAACLVLSAPNRYLPISQQ